MKKQGIYTIRRIIRYELTKTDENYPLMDYPICNRLYNKCNTYYTPTTTILKEVFFDDWKEIS